MKRTSVRQVSSGKSGFDIRDGSGFEVGPFGIGVDLNGRNN